MDNKNPQKAHLQEVRNLLSTRTCAIYGSSFCRRGIQSESYQRVWATSNTF